MNGVEIIYPIVAIGGMGLAFGIGLGIASKKFAVPIDERVEKIKENLPGANCGGCGFAGCEAFAKSVSSGKSEPSGCPVCNEKQVEMIACIMGIQAVKGKRQTAIMRCNGDKNKAVEKFEYIGVTNCTDAHLVNGGPKKCQYGCLGMGSCKKKCQFDAIKMEGGLARIDKDKCKACGSCVTVCPRNIIYIGDYDTSYQVVCQSHDKGKETKGSCRVGCIGCGICVKQCEVNAISLNNNVANIDMKKCISCGKCKAKCPTQAIVNLLEV